MSEQTIKITLIVTTYNRADALGLVLLSIARQTVMPFELIVADDGSGSDTVQLIADFKSKFSFPVVHCWHPDEGFRLAHIRNKAIALASGDYIIMIDGDVVLHRHFIRDHKRNIAPNQFIQGSRALISQKRTSKILRKKITRFSPLSRGLDNRLNAFSCSILSPIASAFYSRKQTHAAVRGCNMSYWKSDLVKVNGFSEEFVGWGREDSEFVVRMLNSGIKRFNLKFGGIVYHLWHKENKTIDLLEKNDSVLARAIDEKRMFCNVGLNQYLTSTNT